MFSFVRSSNSGTGTVSILPILNRIKDTEGRFGNVTNGDLQTAAASPAGPPCAPPA